MVKQLMSVNKIFNPQGDDRPESRSVWFGNTTNLINLNHVRYSWAVSLYKQMRSQFWVPEKIDISPDVTSYNELTNEEKSAFEGILSYLTFLDSIQTYNISHLKNCVTAPEISLCMAEQISQEAMHNNAYSYIIETIIPSEDRDRIYDLWRTDQVLADRCQYIANIYQAYIDESSSDNYFYALIANYILEGIYFQNGFIFFYTLASRMLMGGCSDMIRLIHRDERSHVVLYQKLIVEAMQVFDYDLDRIYRMFQEAVDHENAWMKHIVGDHILGITNESTNHYTQYLKNLRLKAININPIDDMENRNPYKHLEKSADTSNEANTKANFFEAGVTSYIMSSGVSGWEEI